MSQSSWKGFSSKGASQKPRKACANPLFESWIMEWKAEAEAKDNKMKFVYAKALKSLRLYPLPLASGKECSILENFGTHMCKMLDDRMAKENIVPDVLSATQLFGDDADAEGKALKGTKRKKKEANQAGAATTSKSSKKKQNDKTRKEDNEDCIVLSDEEDTGGSSGSKSAGSSGQSKKAPRKKQYIPAYRSGAYAILLALLKKEMGSEYRGYVTKTELIQSAQEYCDASMTKADHAVGKHYTAWSSMKGLLSKELVNCTGSSRGSPPTYQLTSEGRELADKILKAEVSSSEDNNSGQRQYRSSQSSEDLRMSSQSAKSVSTEDSTDSENEVEMESQASSSTSSSPVHSVTLEPGKFEIVLYVDNCEINGKTKSNDLINELQKNGVRTYVTKLSIGDFIWVCRETTPSTVNRNRLTVGNQKELVLPYVVERKRSDDLAHSIRDGRYREQKYRLERTNLQVIYLVESYGKGDWGLQEGALSQAMISTQIKNGFKIQQTSSIKDSCGYLTLMTRHLQMIFGNKTLLGCTKANFDKDLKPSNPSHKYVLLFSDFNDFSIKKSDWNVKEMFARQLMRMKGLSPDKAIAIVDRYPTVHDLLKAYKECSTEKEKELMLSTLFFGNAGRKIGPMISRKIYRLYNSKELN